MKAAPQFYAVAVGREIGIFKLRRASEWCVRLLIV
jgi:hypothetical protein